MEFSGSKKLKSSQLEHINNNGDRISSLPDSILHHILSYHSLHYAVQTSVLSRRWRYLWASLPTLNFNYELSSSLSRIGMHTDVVKDFVDQALFQRDNTNVQSFRLFYGRYTTITRPNPWIHYALRRNVQELSLVLAFDRLFRFPHCLFTSSSLTLLYLNHCGAGQHKLNLPDSIRLPALKTLFLTGIDFEDYDVTNNFFSSCPLLECMRIRNCKMHHTHTIISLLKLKHLGIDNNNDALSDLSPADGSLKLYAPNLINFSCHDFFNINYLLENLSSLVEARIHIEDIDGEYSRIGGSKETFDQNIMKFLRDVQHVKALTLSAYVIQAVSKTYALLESNHTQFCNLRSLKIEYTLISSDCIHAIAYLLKISPNVETLSLSIYEPYEDEDESEDEDQDQDQDLYEEHLEYACRDEINFTSTSTEDYLESGLPSLQCMLHHLKYVEIRGISGCVDELKFLEILLKNAMVLRKVVLFCSKESPGNEPARKRRMMKFSERLLTFPTSAPRIAFLFF